MADTSAQSQPDSNENDEIICRVCRGPSEELSPLFHPCHCRGSIKYVHQDCLLQWLKHSRSSRCEVCKQAFLLTPVYANHAPPALSALEILTALLQRVVGWLPTLMRFLAVAITWGVFVPFLTASLTQVYLCRSFLELEFALQSPTTLGEFGARCWKGVLITCGIVTVVLASSTLREYLRHLAQIEHIAAPEAAININNHNIFNNNDNNDNHNNNNDHNNNYLPNFNLNPRLDELHIDNLNTNSTADAINLSTDQLEFQVALNGIAGSSTNRAVTTPQAVSHNTSTLPPHEHLYLDDESPVLLVNHHSCAPMAVYDEDPHAVALENKSSSITDPHSPSLCTATVGDSGIVETDSGAGPDVRAGADVSADVRACAGACADVSAGADADDGIDVCAGVGAGSGRNIDIGTPVDHGDTRLNYDHGDLVVRANDDYDDILADVGADVGNDGADDNDGGDSDSDVESDGGENDNLMNDIQLGQPIEGILEEIPIDEMLGLTGSWVQFVENVAMMLLLFTLFLFTFVWMPFTFGRGFIFVRRRGLNTVLVLMMQQLHVPVPLVLEATLSANSFVEPPSNDATLLLVGYVIIVLSVFVTSALLAVAASVTNVHSCAQLVPRRYAPAFRRMETAFVQFVLLVKMMCLIVVEVVLIPLFCGILIDICTLPVFGSSVASRIEFFNNLQALAFTIHWAVGFAFMLGFGTFVQVLREFVRPEVLRFIRNPDDPDFNPLRDIAQEPLARHIRRIFLTVVLFTPILGIVFFGPVLLLKVCVRGALPLVLHGLAAAFPVDIFVFHVLIPFAIHYVNVKKIFRALFLVWAYFTMAPFGLQHFFLKPLYVHILTGGREVTQNEVGSAVDLVHPPSLRLRVAAYVGMSCCFVMVFNATVVVVPLVIGRLCMSTLTSAHVARDVYALVVGMFVLLCTGLSLRAVAHEFYAGSLANMRGITSRLVLVCKCAVVGFFVVGVMPLLLGLLWTACVFFPASVRLHQTPFLSLAFCWISGIICARFLWHLKALTMPVVWVASFQRAWDDGLRELRLWFVCRHVIYPLLSALLLALTVPYLVTHVLLRPLLSASTRETLHRFFYCSLVASGILCFALREMVAGFRALHKRIRDEKYLVNVRLQNFNHSYETTISEQIVNPAKSNDLGTESRNDTQFDLVQGGGSDGASRSEACSSALINAWDELPGVDVSIHPSLAASNLETPTTNPSVDVMGIQTSDPQTLLLPSD